VRSSCGNFYGAFHVMLPFDLAEVEFLVRSTGRLPVVRRPNRLENFFATEELDDLREP
jgi:hypothetical protein